MSRPLTFLWRFFAVLVAATVLESGCSTTSAVLDTIDLAFRIVGVWV